jgi:hypothetical protein
VNTVSVADHMQAVGDHLAGLNIGDGGQPTGTGWQGAPGQSAFVPYGICWRIGSNDRRIWSLDGVIAEARMSVFIRCFGATREQAETLLDQVADAMLERAGTGWALQVPGRTVIQIMQDNGSTTTRSDKTEVGIFESGDFYRIYSDPDPLAS